MAARFQRGLPIEPVKPETIDLDVPRPRPAEIRAYAWGFVCGVPNEIDPLTRALAGIAPAYPRLSFWENHLLLKAPRGPERRPLCQQVDILDSVTSQPGFARLEEPRAPYCTACMVLRTASCRPTAWDLILAGLRRADLDESIEDFYEQAFLTGRPRSRGRE